MIQAIIVDDEPINISNLQVLLAKYCVDIHVVATAQNADDAQALIVSHPPDVVFLDIEMPNKNGFDLLKSLSHIDFEVVFVSAYDAYGIMAIKFSALDYLLKPIDTNELKNTVERLRHSIKVKNQNERLYNMLSIMDKKNPDDSQKIALPTQKQTYLIPVKDIMRCESSNNYTTFYLVNGVEHVISKPLYLYEELLSPYGFIRCHQSHLVNKIHVSSLLNEDSGYLVIGGSGAKIPISKQRKGTVKSLLKI